MPESRLDPVQIISLEPFLIVSTQGRRGIVSPSLSSEIIQMQLSKFLLPACLVFTATSGELYAYLDPGTGSILLQGLIATVATVLATGKFWWHRVKSFFIKSDDVNETEDITDDSIT
jgi:hypothetical protein